ncbi:MAG: hypothetical protein WC455_16415 [Dehalococcoidia bacterium]|jgi:hypothetical protein
MGFMNLAPVTAGLVLWNPTNEDFDMQYSGVSFTLKSGEKREIEISAGKHLLNAFGPRGLTSLKYGDEANEERIGRDAIDRNIEFKKRQVVNYNQQNESRKHMNLGYLPPSDIMRRYSKELGLKLLEPYSVRDEERAGIADTRRENEELRNEISELREMMKSLIKSREDDHQDKPQESRGPGNPNWKKRE